MLLRLLTDQNALVSTTALRLLEPFARTDKAVRSANWASNFWPMGKSPYRTGAPDGLYGGSARPNHGPAPAGGHCEPLWRIGPDSGCCPEQSSGSGICLFTSAVKIAGLANRSNLPKTFFWRCLPRRSSASGIATELTALLALVNTAKGVLSWQEKAMLTSLSIQGSNSK